MGDLLRLWDEKVLAAVMAACEERMKEDAKADKNGTGAERPVTDGDESIQSMR